jgi:outer membrane protein OmpA-like peptidoglycan-associated protein
MKSIIITIAFCFAAGLNAFAVDKSNREIKGDKYYFIFAFDKAIDSYKHTKDITVEGQRRLAKSYSNMGKFTESAISYSKLVTMADGNQAEDYFNYAMVLKSNGKYDESNIWMDKYKDLKPAELRTKDYVANKGNLNTMKTDDGKYKVGILDLNTGAQDFGTSYYKNNIVFASTRSNAKMISRRSNWNGQPYLDMYISELEGDQLKKPKVLSKKLDGKMHDGPASFSADGNYAAFTKNNYDLSKKDKVVSLQIFFTNNTNGKWSKEESFYLNNKDYSVGHPCLSANGTTMYFVSNMPGGFGGSDLYKVTKDNKGTWSKAENLGPEINTEGDETFPFYEENSKALLFASNGRFGLGGTDIFICQTNGSKLGAPYNAGAPLNTQYDDYAAIVNTKTNKGYFSSNRVGGEGSDDIYSFDLLKGFAVEKKINGIAKNKDGKELPRTFITLSDEKGNVLDTLTTDAKGAFSFIVGPDKKYELTGKKDKYTDGQTKVIFDKENTVNADVTLLSKEEAIAKQIEVGADLGKILESKPVYTGDFKAETVYFDLDKYNLRPDAVEELKNIVKIMNDYPNMVVELRSYSDCRATKEYNQALSDKRAKTSAWYVKARITKPERISGKGYGEENPVNGCSCEGEVISNCSDEEFQKNRRTEFIIMKK